MYALSFFCLCIGVFDCYKKQYRPSGPFFVCHLLVFNILVEDNFWVFVFKFVSPLDPWLIGICLDFEVLPLLPCSYAGFKILFCFLLIERAVKGKSEFVFIS